MSAAAVLRKVSRVLLWALVLCVSLEAGLRLCGGLYSRYRLRPALRTGAAGRHGVLCLGDSFTFGAGAPKGSSYPEQLQALLDKSGAGKGFSVYNEGRLGRNSSQLLDEIEPLLGSYRPRTVVIMIGANNATQLLNSNYYLFAPRRSLWARAALAGLRPVSGLRLYKLLRWTGQRLRLPWDRLGARLAAGRGRAPRLAPARREENRPLRDRQFAYRDRGDLAQAEAVMREIMRHPGEPSDYCDLAQILTQRGLREHDRTRLEEARRMADDCLALEPDSQSGRLLRATIEKFFDPGAGPEPAALERWLRHDLGRTIRIVNAHGALPIVLSYPAFPHETARAVCLEEGGDFIDVHQRFVEALKTRDPRGLFSGDNLAPGTSLVDSHPNANGYRIIAEQLFETISRLR